MSTPPTAVYNFWPVARRGAAVDIPGSSADPITGPVAVRVAPNVSLAAVANKLDGTTQDVSGGPAGLQLYGPGDVIGFDQRHVVRTEPSDGTVNFESNYFAAIEFDDPDLPWMFTPAQVASVVASGKSYARLRPWVVLLVLADGEYQFTPSAKAGGLATIQLNNDPKLLPNLRESWLWTHVQLTGDLGNDTLDSVFAAHRERLVSRIICPRQLSPNTHYTAYLVPAFNVGVAAAQPQPAGGAAPPATTDVAWDTGNAAVNQVTVPVYFSFSFGTADAGDFESLALLLNPQPLTAVGQRALGVDDPRNQSFWRVPAATSGGAPLHIGGALAGPPPTPPPPDEWTSGDRQAFQPVLAAVVNAATPASDDPAKPDPVVAPPIYGRYHAAVTSVSPASGWANELNLDPRVRGGAGLGAKIVTAERSQLMASAWRQIAGIQLANQVLRHAQLARASLQQTYLQSFIPAAATTVLTMTANVQRRVLSVGQTVWSTISGSVIPWRVFAPTIRRIARPRGPWRQRQDAYGQDLSRLIRGINDGTIVTEAPPGTPDGTVSMPTSGQPGTGGVPGWIRPSLVVVAVILAVLTVLEAVGRQAGFVFLSLVLLVVDLVLLYWAKKLSGSGGTSSGSGPWRWVRAILIIIAIILVVLIVVEVAHGKGSLALLSLILLAIDLFLLFVNWRLSQIASAGSGGGTGGGGGSGSGPGTLPGGGGFVTKSVAGPPLPGFVFTQPGTTPVSGSGTPGQDSPDAAGFRAGLKGIVNLVQVAAPPPQASPSVDLTQLGTAVVGALDPRITVVRRAAGQVGLSAQIKWQPADAIEPIMAAPTFPQPMYAPLRDISQEFLLPGVGQIPANSVGLLVPNFKFIESYMVGLNFEMARQLLWNGYPTDQRGSYFRQFWDVSGYVRLPTDPPAGSDALSEKLRDIPPIHTWDPATALGAHPNPLNPDAAGALVLLVRGELLRRYPTAIVYATPAVPDPAGGNRFDGGPRLVPTDDVTQEIHPLFRGTLSPDLTYLGFPFDQTAATSGGEGYGYFFVLAQHPTEPRFGLETGTPNPDSGPVTWDYFQTTGFATAAAQTMVAPDGSTLPPLPAKWGVDSADIAAITFRQPVRVAFYAPLMLPGAAS